MYRYWLAGNFVEGFNDFTSGYKRELKGIACNLREKLPFSCKRERGSFANRITECV